MSPEDIPKIFRLDSRYTIPGTELEKGTGLGLVLCNDVLRKHGRKLEIDSSSGEGSHFSFILAVV